jgi:hypothetical protein
MADIKITVTKEELFIIRSALRVAISGISEGYEDDPTPARLEEIKKTEALLKRLGGANGASTPNKT